MPCRSKLLSLLLLALLFRSFLATALPPPRKPAKPAPASKAVPPPTSPLPSGVPPLLKAVPLGPQPPLPLPKPSAPTRPLLFGVNVAWGENGGLAGWDRDNGAQARRLVTALKAAGVTNTCVAIGWADVEKTRGSYDWGHTDRFLRFVKAQGFILTGVVQGTPDWAARADPAVRKLFADRGMADRSRDLAPDPSFYADLGRFAFQLGKRYKDLVHRWEFRPEPDGLGLPSVMRDVSGNPTDLRFGDASLYARLLRLFSENIKRADPNCLVAVGGLTTPRTDFLQALYADGARKTFDAVALRPAGGLQPLAFDWIDACHQVMQAHGDARKKLWLTAWGWNTYPDTPEGIVEGEQARFVQAGLAGLRDRGFIEQADFQTLNDWRVRADDPLSLVSTGLITPDLLAKPAYATFQAEAHGLPPPDSGRSHPVALVAGEPEPGEAAANLDVYANRIVDALPSIARALAPEVEPTAALPAAWDDFAPRLKATGIALVRVAPFRAPGSIMMGASGTPSVQWDTADSALHTLAAAGKEAILELTPPISMTPAAWSAFVTQAAHRYGSDPKFAVARWELGGASEDIQRWYEPFAKAVRAALPTTPIGFRLTEGDPVAAAQTLAALCTAQAAPCDSLAWPVDGSPTEAAQTVRRVRAVLGHYPALKGLTLWPAPIVAETDIGAAAQVLATAARLTDYAPLNQPNPLGGIALAVPEARFRPGSSAALWNAVTLLNRVSGARLHADSDNGNARCLAVRAVNGTTTILVWREGGEAGTLRTTLRLHGLPRAASGGLRMEAFLVDAAHSSGEIESGDQPRTAAGDSPDTRLERVALADLPVGGAESVALPLVLTPDAVMLIQLRPQRPGPVQLTLAASRFRYVGGEELPLTVTMQNTSKTPQRADVQLVGTQEGLVPSALFRTSVGMLAPGVSRIVRFRLRVPPIARDTLAFLNVQVGAESRSALAIQLDAPLAVTLDTPRVDLAAPGAKATVRVRLINRTHAPMSLAILAGRDVGHRPANTEPLFDLPGGGKPLVREVQVAAPTTDPGNYLVPLAIASKYGTITTLPVLLGVPILCRYTAQMPIVDGDLREWADADPLGMGRREQVHDKVWRGPADLSAIAFAKWDDRFFYFACAVTDDVPFQPFTAPELRRGDSVVFALSPDRNGPANRSGYGPGDQEIGLALLNLTQPVLYRFAGPPGIALGPIPHSVVAIRRDGTHTYYEAAIPWSELAPAIPQPGAIFGFSVVVNDNDGQGRGYIEWGGGLAADKRPGQFPPLRLVR